jgi:hypothetical protein
MNQNLIKLLGGALAGLVYGRFLIRSDKADQA